MMGRHFADDGRSFSARSAVIWQSWRVHFAHERRSFAARAPIISRSTPDHFTRVRPSFEEQQPIICHPVDCYIRTVTDCMNSLVPPEMCYSRPVISRRFRDLRESQGKTQRDIAEGGGFTRSQLQLLERGSNVTLTTLQKAVSQLDGMRVDIIPAGLDVEQIRSAAIELREIGTQLTAVSDRLLHAVGSGPAHF